MREQRLLRYHEYTRKHGVNWLMYAIVRGVLQPALLIYLRLSRQGREHARVRGGLLVAANHRSFLDPFVIGVSLPWRRPMNYVAKIEMFEKRWQGWLLSRLGAFPIRRGEADEEAPRRGVGRLALETGAPVLPMAVLGTEHVRRGWRIRPRKVKIRAGRPMTFPQAEHPSPALAASVTARIWPNIELQWEDLGGLPPMRRAAVIGAGSWGTAVAVLLARGGLEVQLGTRTAEQADELAEGQTNERYLAGVRLPESVQVKRAADIELAGLDLVCLAVPTKGLPQAVGQIADRLAPRSAVLMLSKGLVAPQGHIPSDYVGERVRARGIASLGGPAQAREAVSGSAALVLGSPDYDLRTQLGEVFDRAGLVCERCDDVAGVEMAGAAKNAAALAAAAAEPHGRNAAGIAAAEIWRECIDYAVTLGAEPETFSGLAGVGDLTATVLAPGSRNRRAGELLGRGTPAEQIPAIIGQTSEGLDSVPLIASTIAAAGIDASGLDGLAALIAGRIGPDEWVAGLRRTERSRRAA
jgi:glycerol-3-phosphate dehydrogenase (NAD(P)+)